MLLTIDDPPPGWVLVESWLDPPGRRLSASLRVRRRNEPRETEELLLPVLPDGRIHEIVRLPDREFDLEWQLPPSLSSGKPHLRLTPLGWFSRTWRMANRALRTWLRLSRQDRRENGLSLRTLVFDLPRAYRVASEFRVHYSMEQFAQWATRFDTLNDTDHALIERHIGRMAIRPYFRVVVLASPAQPGATHATLVALRDSLYRDYSSHVLYLDGDPGLPFDVSVEVVAHRNIPAWLDAFNASLRASGRDEWIMLLRAGDLPAAHALYWFASTAITQPDAAIIYSDDDAVDTAGVRSAPRFKPDWSIAHYRSTDFIGSAAVLRGSSVVAAGGIGNDCVRHGPYDLALRIIDHGGEQVAHIPAVLLHCLTAVEPAATGISMERSSGCRQALQAHFSRNGIDASVEATLPDCRRIRYRLPQGAPLVSIIVPTRDKVELLRDCLTSVLELTTYPRFEILVVDNRSSDADALDYLEAIAREPNIRVFRYASAFNYSAINNYAAAGARGEVLCLLNNDTAVISPDWLDEMVGHLLQHRVGVVGAKLYYGNGRVQHGGDAVGPGGCANHLHAMLERHDPGYCNRAAVAQELSAVTAACLVTHAGIFRELGGLDAKRLHVAFNDVDYCLRVRAAGYRVVWTPHAELYHYESVSRGGDDSLRRKLRARREVAVMRRRWSHLMRNDPFYNPNLSYMHPDFSLNRLPRVAKPWRE